MIEYDGERYLTIGEIAQRFKISRATCYNNLLQRVQKCYLPGRKHALYKQSDVARFAEVRLVAHTTWSMSPASPITEETGNGVTSSPNFSLSLLGWHGQYSLPVHQTQHPLTSTSLERQENHAE